MNQPETPLKPAFAPDLTRSWLAVGIIAAFVVMTSAVLLGYAKADSALAGTLVGYLSAKAEQVLSYFFGSTRGSDKKTELLARAGALKE